MTQNNAEFPRINALVRADATGQVIINGVSQVVVAVDDAGVREEIVAVATGVARDLDSPVRLEVEDEQGLWPLMIFPDGRVKSAGDVIAMTGPLGTHTVAITNSESPGTGETGHGQAADAVVEVSGVDEAARPGNVAAALEPVTDLSFAQLLRPASSTHPFVDSGTHASTDTEARPSSRSVGFNASNLTQFDPAPDDSPGFAPRYSSFLPNSGRTTDSDAAEDSSDASFISSLMNTSGLPDGDTETRSDDSGPGTRAERPIGAQSSARIGPPNLADFMSSRPEAQAGPALQGWQGAIRRLTGGLISVSASASERAQRNAISAVQRSLSGPRTIAVLNPKGGAHKTTATLLIAATFGIYRGGYTLAWDNNETMGTLGVRAQAARHTNTAVDLLRDLDRFSEARVGDLDNYVRNQGDAQFDALASDLDPAGAASIDAVAFRKLHAMLSRFYRVLVIDTGNNMRASNWEAAVDTADQLVVVSTIREDTGYGAASLLDGLRRKGHADKVAQAVTILASPSKTVDQQLSARLHDHFGQLTRTVLEVPHDPSLVGGGPLNVDTLAPRTRAAWLQATAAIAEGL
ncbi:MinD/ParA family ATP-binding protein [Cryobacterium psychrophilum]|uniref:Chromosome partitioning protein n=1 Tax=Cryobacterium psychrophilum TaxID=41988 RepID=A0A4Y8KPC4_9MICO|nr:chromosome partitioning protein [Cryobacterium psychrophilum]TDW30378.1 MinD-like ATPase involved in chromosome partitioning or flagellar assembly [Cryobacterium psychrophilum]TFD79068.1 chromosome partitioning protein [Cryobacterium psychrophilum]